jgi:hypothetical protein
MRDARAEALRAGAEFWKLATIAYLQKRPGIADCFTLFPRTKLLGNYASELLDLILRESLDVFERRLTETG